MLCHSCFNSWSKTIQGWGCASQAELGLLDVCQRGSCDCSALDMPGNRSFNGSDHLGRLEKSGVQVAGQAVPITKEVTSGVVRPGGKEVARIADKYSDDATRDKVQVRYCQYCWSPLVGKDALMLPSVLVFRQKMSLKLVAVQVMA